jgi:hypothetical protein
MRHVCSTVTVPEARTEGRKQKVRKNEAMNKRSKSLVSGRQHGSIAKSVEVSAQNTSFALNLLCCFQPVLWVHVPANN